MTAHLYLLAECIDWVCRTYKGSVTSWWRSPERNTAKGGKPNSLHLHGLAVDVVYEGEPPPLVSLEAVALSYAVRVVREHDHDHFQSDWPLVWSPSLGPRPGGRT